MKSSSASLLLLLLAACGSADRKPPRSSSHDDGPRIVERDYAKPAPEVWRAAKAALESMDLRIDDDRHDKLGGTIVARRGSDDRLTVQVAGLDEHRSKVVVQVDPGNGNLATTVQDRITEKLGLSQAKTGFLGGNSVEGRYACTLSQGATAAEQVVHRLGLELLSIDVRQDLATVDARDADSTPIRFKFTRVDHGMIKALFTVGTTSHAGAKNTAKRLKSEFDRDLFPPLEQ